MALSLIADKRNIGRLFDGRDKFVVPEYQRAYSWTDDENIQLFQDLFDAFRDDEEYFVGNILLCRGYDDDNILRVVDGQQRLTTIWIILKVLSELFPDIPSLRDFLQVKSWDGNNMQIKVESLNNDYTDAQDLMDVLGMNINDLEARYRYVLNSKKNEVRQSRCRNKIEYATMIFYDCFQYQASKNREKFRDFVKFLLSKVYLLVVELSDDSVTKAEIKAQKIFQTLNTRGSSLTDSDLFKSTLYNNALKHNELEKFRQKWDSFVESCKEMYVSVEDVFRYYSHVVRGERGITTREIGLLDFFEQGDTPMTVNTPCVFMDDLLKSTEVLFLMKKLMSMPTETCAWLQIIDVYSNKIPMYAVFVYLYKYGVKSILEDDQQFLEFLQAICRLIYMFGPTTSVKFPIYGIIATLTKTKNIGSYRLIPGSDKVEIHDRLKKGFGLMAFYLQHRKAVVDYTVDVIMRNDDVNEVVDEEKAKRVLNSIGNIVITDLPKRYISLKEKRAYFSMSELMEVREISEMRLSLTDIERRNTASMEIINQFMFMQ